MKNKFNILGIFVFVLFIQLSLGFSGTPPPPPPGSMINNSYFVGEIIATGDNVGGLIGLLRANGGYIENSYTIATISGNDKVGGLVGQLYGDIDNSYSVSNVSGIGLELGGFIGNNLDGFIVNSYYNNVSENPDLGIGIDNNAQVVNVVQDDVSYFFDSINEPMSSLDSAIWSFSGSSLPVFIWE